MNPARVAARHPRAVLLVTGLLAAAGLLCARSLPSDIYPPLKFPRIAAIAHSGTLPGRSMMLSVARPIEQAVMEVPGIRRVRSKTFRGATEISAQFDPESDILQALQQVQNGVAELRSDLPAETELTVERLTPAAFPILSYNLTGGLSVPDLYDDAFLIVRPEIARVPGVGRVEILASDTREIEVVVDPTRLLSTGLTVKEVADALKAANELAPVARYPQAGLQYLVLASGPWSRLEDIAETPIVARGGTLRLADVASVFAGSPDRTSLVTGNGREAAIVNVSQQPGANILEVRDGVERALGGLAERLPSGLKLSKVYDLAGFVSDAIGSVRDAILLGGLLAIVVLFLFLREWRITLVAALTLPLTVVSTFAFMRLFGETINLMSMGGLAVAIGLVIDDAVVVVENIHRHLAEGHGKDAIDRATAELVAPVVGSTLTTVVVFAPLGFLSGVVGQFFRALSITLSVSVLLSLVFALTLIPLLAQWAYREGAPPSSARRMETAYARLLDRALGHSRALLLAVGGLVVASVLLYLGVGSGFLPKMDEGGFVIDYRSPAGSALAETDRRIRKVEEIVAHTPEVASFSRRTGSELGLFATEPNKGDFVVRLKPRGERRRSADAVIDDLRGKINDASVGLESLEFVQLLQDMIGDLQGSPAPLEVKIFGEDPEKLMAVAEEIEPRVKEVRGVVDLVGAERGSPEVTWKVDAPAAARLGLTVAEVSEQLKSAWLGTVATDLRLPSRTVPVRVRYPDKVRLDPDRLAQTTVRGASGQLVPVSALAKAQSAAGEPILLRENLRPMTMITARLEGRDLGSAVAEVRQKLEAQKLPPGYTLEIGGQLEAQRQSFRELLTVLVVAACLVLVVLVTEFGAFTPALLILGAAPLSFAGGLLMLLLTGTELNVSSAMGFILLIGLVVKNGIVMIDYAHHLHGRGMPFAEAVAQAAHVRLRPILMTTLCTLFGLLPLALGLGAGAELQKPLALVVIGGLTLSTLVTLFAVPTFYVALRARRDAAPAA